MGPRRAHPQATAFFDSAFTVLAWSQLGVTVLARVWRFWYGFGATVLAAAHGFSTVLAWHGFGGELVPFVFGTVLVASWIMRTLLGVGKQFTGGSVLRMQHVAWRDRGPRDLIALDFTCSHLAGFALAALGWHSLALAGTRFLGSVLRLCVAQHRAMNCFLHSIAGVKKLSR